MEPYQSGEEEQLIGLFEDVYRSYFGARRKTAPGWLARREKVLEENHGLIQVAREGDRVVGWAGCFDQWVGRVVELHVRPGNHREAIAAGLLGRVEKVLLGQGAEQAHLWAPEEEPFPGELLVRSGYRFRPMRVFYLAVIDLPGLLGELRPVLDGRLAGYSGWQGRLSIETPSQKAVLEVSSSVAVRKSGPSDAALRMSDDALCRLLSGRRSAWELYLDNALDVSAAATPDLADLLRVLFPFVPAFHPADDLW
jgi:hypothetical protein